MTDISTGFNPKRILVIKLRHHGDILLTTPVINALHERYPIANIDVLLYKETRPLLEAHPAINRLFFVDRQWKKEGIRRHLGHGLRLLRAIQRQEYDLIINLADQWSSAILTLLSKAPVRIGFNYQKRQHLLWRRAHTQRVETERFPQLHTVEQNMLALKPLNIANKRARLSMHYHQSDWHYTRRILDERGISRPYVVIQPTSRWIFKCWDDDKVARLLKELSCGDCQLILTAAPDSKELEMITNICRLTKDSRVFSLAGQLSLTQLAALIDHAALFIGVDSAPMHIAAALGTPCIALFGPSRLIQWRPWGENNLIIWAGDFGELPSPDNIDTDTETRFLSQIPVEVVLNAARSYLR